ncbi:hypothetical protein F5050DRAFT_1713670 [Lentinula boryana]|uniref:Uncharacterized protein n=1 Tax=Lentinula boryana TaxID=40481 RepID=A0ABQ8Q7D8_9AGAR|nr:hypothetical protein F5050DRAFT_1713670 [Lentinula boryana]
MIRNPSQPKRPPNHHQEMETEREKDTYLNIQGKDPVNPEEHTRGTEGASEPSRELDSYLLSHPDATDSELNQNTTTLRNDHQNLSSEFNQYGKPRIAVTLPGEIEKAILTYLFPVVQLPVPVYSFNEATKDPEMMQNHGQHHSSPSITSPDISQQMTVMGDSDTSSTGIMSPSINLGTCNPSAFSHIHPLNTDALNETNVNICAGNPNSIVQFRGI